MGLKLGAFVGLELGGSSTPLEIGLTLGLELGEFVGFKLGECVGLELGEFVGLKLGDLVGSLEGDTVGLIVSEGCPEGLMLGLVEVEGLIVIVGGNVYIIHY